MIDWILVLKVLQLILSLLLVLAVMLHSAKGEGIGAIGGQAKIFGSQKGVEAGLNRFAASSRGGGPVASRLRTASSIGSAARAQVRNLNSHSAAITTSGRRYAEPAGWEDLSSDRLRRAPA